jgi:hypothetical protein
MFSSIFSITSLNYDNHLKFKKDTQFYKNLEVSLAENILMQF